MTPALTISSLAFAIPAYVAWRGDMPMICSTVALLLATSILQHATSIRRHTVLRWVDRVVAASVTVGYTMAAASAGHALPAACGTTAAIMYVASKRCSGASAQRMHVMVHVVGAVGLTGHFVMLSGSHG